MSEKRVGVPRGEKRKQGSNIGIRGRGVGLGKVPKPRPAFIAHKKMQINFFNFSELIKWTYGRQGYY